MKTCFFFFKMVRRPICTQAHYSQRGQFSYPPWAVNFRTPWDYSEWVSELSGRCRGGWGLVCGAFKPLWVSQLTTKYEPLTPLPALTVPPTGPQPSQGRWPLEPPKRLLSATKRGTRGVRRQLNRLKQAIFGPEHVRKSSRVQVNRNLGFLGNFHTFFSNKGYGWPMTSGTP